MFNVIRWGSYYNDFELSLASNLIEFPLHIILVYVNIYYIIPKIILKKKYGIFILILTTLLIIAYCFRVGLNYLFVTEELWPEARGLPTNPTVLNHFIAEVLGEIYVITFVTAIKLLVDWIIEKRRNEDLFQLQMSTELKYLRTQIQPHFFFNTLNNLYALSLKKSDRAPRLVLKLSDMMQYILYEVESSKANLLREINHINNFIDIERIRFNDRFEFDMDITGDIEGLEVPPLLFLSFVENCFKHGLKGNDKMKVTISFTALDNGYLKFNVANNFNPNTIIEENQGIGISNAKKEITIIVCKQFCS